MDDTKIVQLYWDRDEQAIPATSEKYEGYCTSIAKNILGTKKMLKNVSTIHIYTHGTPYHRTDRAFCQHSSEKLPETYRLTDINIIPPTNEVEESFLQFLMNCLIWYLVTMM